MTHTVRGSVVAAAAGLSLFTLFWWAFLAFSCSPGSNSLTDSTPDLHRLKCAPGNGLRASRCHEASAVEIWTRIYPYLLCLVLFMASWGVLFRFYWLWKLLNSEAHPVAWQVVKVAVYQAVCGQHRPYLYVSVAPVRQSTEIGHSHHSRPVMPSVSPYVEGAA